MIMTCRRTHHSDWGSRLARALGSSNPVLPLFLMIPGSPLMQTSVAAIRSPWQKEEFTFPKQKQKVIHQLPIKNKTLLTDTKVSSKGYHLLNSSFFHNTCNINQCIILNGSIDSFSSHSYQAERLMLTSTNVFFLPRKPQICSLSMLLLFSSVVVTHYLDFRIGLPRWHSSKESSCQCRRHKRSGFDPWVGKISWSRKWQLVFNILAWEIPRTEEPWVYGPWCCKEPDVTEYLQT